MQLFKKSCRNHPGHILPPKKTVATEARSASRQTPSGSTDWASVVARIRAGDQSAEVELYEVFSRGIRFMILRQLGPDELEDNVHDFFVATLQAVRRGDIREPERLMGFVRTIVQRKIVGKIGERVEVRARFVAAEGPLLENLHQSNANPESIAVEAQRVVVAREYLAKLPVREREILTRFYIHEESKEQICNEMDLTETQFRLLKSRTKARIAARTERIGIPSTNRTIPRYGAVA